jgi:hypothetical protein
MTVIPPAVREPLRRFDRIAGPIVFLLGILLFAAVLIWLGLYLHERALGQFFSEWAYWLPVCMFLAPAIHLIYYGKEMMLGHGIPLLTYFEIFAILIGLTIVGLIAFT